ncbi:MAG TPA: peptide-methionine (S)-S-oxide reductase MsrA [Burkholderiales bacterium]|nr:peptide-methionine (S)-S-oxide reductase MsrA [Burkholderiales bacterium]
MLTLRNVLLALCASLLLTAIAANAQTTKPAAGAATAKAIFAGGCFWCMEHPFDVLPGVVSTTSGYIGGQKKNPTYEEVSSGRTGHTEAVQVVYDPKKVTYEKLLDVFWHNIDPTVKDQQFCDHGSQYRSGIFYTDDEQKRLAEASKATLDRNKPFSAAIVTEITRASEFYPAEDYHQDFYLKNPLRYKYYRSGCGRDARLKQLWGKAPE